MRQLHATVFPFMSTVTESLAQENEAFQNKSIFMGTCSESVCQSSPLKVKGHYKKLRSSIPMHRHDPVQSRSTDHVPPCLTAQPLCITFTCMNQPREGWTGLRSCK